ncbi:DUF6809 family protein [Caldifermentibacillus hisashii]|uniref:DUF6809 family protein n=1 Tax=Caldifermentibacillus hisashii TaxID=996558 RepID=UPI0031B6E300
MKSVMHSLYSGAIIPWERSEPDSEKRHEILQKLEDEERYFMEKMSLDDCQRFQALSSLHMELSTIGEENLFSYAFTLGMVLAMDVMKEAKGIFND